MLSRNLDQVVVISIRIPNVLLFFNAGQRPEIQQCPGNLIKETDPGKPTAVVVWDELWCVVMCREHNFTLDTRRFYARL